MWTWTYLEFTADVPERFVSYNFLSWNLKFIVLYKNDTRCIVFIHLCSFETRISYQIAEPRHLKTELPHIPAELLLDKPQQCLVMMDTALMARHRSPVNTQAGTLHQLVIFKVRVYISLEQMKQTMYVCMWWLCVHRVISLYLLIL